MFGQRQSTVMNKITVAVVFFDKRPRSMDYQMA